MVRIVVGISICYDRSGCLSQGVVNDVARCHDTSSCSWQCVI